MEKIETWLMGYWKKEWELLGLQKKKDLSNKYNISTNTNLSLLTSFIDINLNFTFIYFIYKIKSYDFIVE